MTFDREMQSALLADAQKLRDMGVECDDPFFFDTVEDLTPDSVTEASGEHAPGPHEHSLIAPTGHPNPVSTL